MSYQPQAVAEAPKSGGLDYKWKVLLSVVFGLFMVILDSTVINVALKTLQSEFNVGTNEAQWVISVYTLALGIATPLSGFLGDRFGIKRVYLAGLVLFVVGSFLCGIVGFLPGESSLPLLVGFRVLQGAGGGIALPLATSLLFGAFKREEQGLAFGIFGIVLVFAPASGPLLGGWLVDQNLWEWIFFINIPIGVVGLVLAGLWLKKDVNRKNIKVDVLGIIFSTIGFGAVLYAASIAGEAGWGAWEVITGFVVGGLGLIAFAFTELRVSEPLLDLRLFQIRNYLVSNIVGWVGILALFGAEFLLPLYLQILRGKSAFDTGLILLPLAIASGFATPIAGKLADKFGPRPLAITGFALLAFNTWQLAQIQIDTEIGYLAFLMVLRGLALGLVIQNTVVAALRDVPLPKLSRASALINSTRQTIQAIGIAALATVLTNAITVQIPESVKAMMSSSGGFDPNKIPQPLRTQAVQQFQEFQNQYIQGLHNAYIITMILGIVATILSGLLPGWPGAYEKVAPPAGPPAQVEAPEGAPVVVAHSS